MGYRTYRIDIHQRDASKVTNQRNELVQVIGASPRNQGAESHHKEAEHVLLPLDVRVVLAALGEERVLGDPDGGEDLQRGRQQDGERVQELHAVDQLVVLGQVEQHDRLGLGAVGGVRDGAHDGKQGGDNDHDHSHHLGELLRVAHGLLDRNDQADALEGEDGCADEERPVLLVEHDDVGQARGVERQHVVVEEVGETDDDEGIGNEGGESQLADVTQKREGQEDDHLHDDQP